MLPGSKKDLTEARPIAHSRTQDYQESRTTAEAVIMRMITIAVTTIPIPYTLKPNPSTLNPTQNPKPQTPTIKSRPFTLNPHATPNKPWALTLKHKPYTLKSSQPKPNTLNPKAYLEDHGT